MRDTSQSFCLLSFLLFLSEEPLDKVEASHLAEQALDVLTFGWLVPEEELALSKLFFLCLGREDGLERVGVKAGVPGFCGDCHGGRREVLHLLQLEVEVFGLCCKFCHILCSAAGVRTDEVGDDLRRVKVVLCSGTEWCFAR